MRRRKTNKCILILLIIATVFTFISLRSLVGPEELQHNTTSSETQKQTDDSTTTYAEFIDGEKEEDSSNLSLIAILILCGITVVALLEALTLKYNMKKNK